MTTDSLLMLVAISGQTGSGKTSLAVDLSRRLNARIISFGSYIRTEAQYRRLALDRITLQNLGQTLITMLGPDEFVKQVLHYGKADERTITLLDGVRSVEVWHAIQKITIRNVLVYLNIQENTRIERLVQRDKLDKVSIQLVLRHEMEINIPHLIPFADLVVDEASDANILRIIDFLRSKGLLSNSH